MKFKMKLFFICLGIGILFSSCADSQENYFEGILEYSVDYDIKNPAIPIENLKMYFGTKIITKFSKGNFRYEYYNNKGILVRTSILNLDKKKYYFDHYRADTIYYSDIDKTDYSTKIKHFPDTNILNTDCWVLKSISVHKTNPNIEPVITKFYISKDLKVNPEWFSSYIDGGYDRILNLAPGINLMEKVFMKNFTIIKSLVSKNKMTIESSEFEINSNKFMKKMN
jgi:hypothetical protein